MSDYADSIAELREVQAAEAARGNRYAQRLSAALVNLTDEQIAAAFEEVQERQGLTERQRVEVWQGLLLTRGESGGRSVDVGGEAAG